MAEEIEQRIAKLERTLKGIKSNKNARLAGGLAGAVAGAFTGHYIFGEPVRNIADGIETAYHGLRVAGQLANYQTGNSRIVQNYLGEIAPEVRQEYEKNLAQESLLFEGSKEALEALQRGSLKLPTQEAKPVRELKSLKGKIITETKKLFTKDDTEVDMAASPQYQLNYNQLAELRLSAIENRELVQSELENLALKLETSKQNTGKTDGEGVTKFEKLVREYNKVSDILADIKEMKVSEIYGGTENENFRQVIAEAKEHGVIPYKPGALADAGIYVLLGLGTYAGYKIGRNIAGLVMPVVNSVKTIDRGTRYIGRGLINLGQFAKKFAQEKMKRKSTSQTLNTIKERR